MKGRWGAGETSSGPLAHAHSSHLPRRQRHYARWRAISLVTVYLLMAIHVAHWKLSGRTLAPLELNEVMYTLEAGIVTAGFIFMSLAVLSVLIFGRFFCSWGCHILALQDFCQWLLGKLHIRPKPVRSRTLLLVPVGAMLYMFVWPQIARLIANRPAPTWQILGDGQGWASFVTNDFWRNLPGPGMALITFAICGFLIVYILGSRSFCTYACPYGAIFAIADRFAPGKIKAVGDRTKCEECGLCTAVCESHIRVHTELTVFGKVVSPACLKDLDCVSVCPNGSIAYGFTTPSIVKSWRKFGRFGVPYDFMLLEDVLMAAVFIASLLIFRGLYDVIPFLLTLALGGILAYGCVLLLRLFSTGRARNVRLNLAQLKRDGRITRAGGTFIAIMLLALAFTVHSGMVRYHEVAAKRGLASLTHDMHAQKSITGSEEGGALLSRTIDHLQFCENWGLLRSPRHSERLATAYLWNDQPLQAEPSIRRLLTADPVRHDWRISLAAILLIRNQPQEAIAHLQFITAATVNGSSDSDRAAHDQARQMLDEIARAMSSESS